MAQRNENSNFVNKQQGLWPDDYDEPYEELEMYQKLMDKSGYYCYYKDTGGEAVIFPWDGVLVKIHDHPAYFEVLKIDGDHFLKYQPRGLGKNAGTFQILAKGLKGTMYDPSRECAYTADVRRVVSDLYDKATFNVNSIPRRNFPKEILPDVHDFMQDPFRFPPHLLKLDRLT